MRSRSIVLASFLTLAACRTVQTQAPSTIAPPIAAGAKTLPAGLPLHVELQDTLSTKQSHVGDDVRATLTSPIVDGAGATLVPAGASVTGKVTELSPSPREGSPATVRVAFNQLEASGGEAPIAAEITEVNPKLDRSYGGVKKGAAVGGATGAAVGVIVGRSLKGAIIGGLLGAGAGTAVSLGSGDVNASIPAGSPMTLKLTEAAPIP